MIKKLKSIINKEIDKKSIKPSYNVKIGEVAKIVGSKTITKKSF